MKDNRYKGTKPNHILTTAEVRDEKTAVEEKIKALRPKFLGIPLIRFDITKIRKVYVPYRFMIFNFSVARNIFLGKSDRPRKTGEIAMIFDLNEVHSLPFDTEENGEIQLDSVQLDSLDGICLPEQCTEKEANEIASWKLQNRILRRMYGTEGKVKLVRDIPFYRPAQEIELVYRGKESTNKRYAYLDSYGLQSEHIVGMRTRFGG